MRLRLALLPILLGSVLILTPMTFANAAVTVSDDIFIINPASPGPNESVNIRLGNTSELPIGNSIKWFVDGVEMTGAANNTAVDFKTKGVGEETLVRVEISSLSEGFTTASVQIIPARIDMNIGANTHVPDFYQGRALPSGSSEISASALVFANEGGPFGYTWSVNGDRDRIISGQGSNQIVFRPVLDYELSVQVEVTNLQGELIGVGETLFELVEPEIHFYEVSPLRGLIPNVIRSPFTFFGDEITLRGVPFNFPGNLSTAAIKWTINGSSIDSDTDPLELTLIKAAESGQARVGLDIINTVDYSAAAEADLMVTY